MRRLLFAAACCLLAAGCARPPARGFSEVRVPALEAPSEATAVAAFDADGDGRLDVLVLRGAGGALLFGDGMGGFRAKESPPPKAAFEARHVAAADYDNDGDVDVFLSGPGGAALWRNDGKGSFSDVTSAAGLSGAKGGRAVFLDANVDGALDLFLAGRRHAFYRNRGNGTFMEAARRLGIAGGGAGAPFPSDIDHDRDTDLLVAEPSGPVRLYRNDRRAGFAEDAAKEGLGGVVAAGVAVEDFDGDRRRDAVFLSTGCGPNRLFLRRGSGGLEESRSAGYLGRGGTGVAAWDFDADGDLDVLIAGACAPGGRLLLENRGGAFEDASTLLPAGRGEAQAFALGDTDGDGAPDVLVVEGGRPRLLRNEASGGNRRLRARLRGAQGSSKDGLGAKLEAKAGSLWVERELTGMAGSSSQSPGVVDIGVGRARAEMLRVSWPTGIRQAVADPPPDAVIELVEKGQKSSCPFLFVWDGAGYRFVSDFLGAGFIGILTGPGAYYKPRPDEVVRVEPGWLKPKGGRYELRVTEQLEEVDYFDEVRLLAVDHEPGVEVYPDERLVMRAPWPSGGVVAVRGPRPLASAVDDQGRDLAPRLARRDRSYPDGFTVLPFEGYTQANAITLDLGRGPGSVLLMDGWLRYWTSNSAALAAANGVGLQPPSLEVRDGRGRWVRARADLGLPAGLPKTVVADLAGAFRSADRVVRIRTNMEVYWDRIVTAEPAGPETFRTTELAPLSAELGWLGYPRQTSPDGRPPFEYDYRDVEPSAEWRTPAGFYTSYGDVAELLARSDDRFVVMTHGEEVALSFDASALPPLPDGWRRDFFVRIDGFVKEMNPHTAHLGTVEPLPFHAMSNYPYGSGERYPDDAAHEDYRRRWNRRWLPATAARGPVSGPGGCRGGGAPCGSRRRRS